MVGGDPAGRMNREAPMPALTRFVLRHKALVALVWLVVAVAGVLGQSRLAKRIGGWSLMRLAT